MTEKNILTRTQILPNTTAGATFPIVELNCPLVAGHSYRWVSTLNGVDYPEDKKSPVWVQPVNGVHTHILSADGKSPWFFIREVIP